ncbi:MAG: hypothetical protein AB9897_08520 [Anaerolineaceae bacterium]
MKTPSGIECHFFYGDYYRGKNLEECRLLGNSSSKQNWTSELCKNCPVPAIKRANACESMVLTLNIKKKPLKARKIITVSAYCPKSGKIVDVPEIGCGICHPLSDIFTEM